MLFPVRRGICIFTKLSYFNSILILESKLIENISGLQALSRDLILVKKYKITFLYKIKILIKNMFEKICFIEMLN